ncbi:DUF2946 family protein [Polaromonas eurypsychrophila]|uniref:DUF2946 family protein n=1 Tax=Polaromonas eurypsychrophila TaxID=1614635 RepID=UPI00227AB069|nr:DUF2946 family protein [Polaromonas eurypsychrophila]
MPTTPSSRPLWARLAAWLGCLAVFAALIAPVSMLAEDVRTGQLGGLCSATGSGQPGSDDASSANGHCDLCGSAGLALPPLAQSGSRSATVMAMALVFEDAVRSASSPGLPFSRGPPAL